MDPLLIKSNVKVKFGVSRRAPPPLGLSKGEHRGDFVCHPPLLSHRNPVSPTQEVSGATLLYDILMFCTVGMNLFKNRYLVSEQVLGTCLRKREIIL